MFKKIKLKNVIIFICVILVGVTLFTKQVDFPTTFKNVFKSILQKYNDLVAVREPDRIYQNGIIVGDVTPSVGEYDDKILFSQLHNTSKLDTNEPFEYQRYKLKIISIKRRYGRRVTKYNTYVDVLQQVECAIIK